MNYQEQDRGNTEQYKKYLAGMDSVIVEKIAAASAYIPHKEDYSIIDVGMASGTGTYILALLFPKCKVVGVDVNPKMVEIASETYQLPNLEFIVDDGEKLNEIEGRKVIGFFNCSSIHHITSFNNYNPHKAYLTIKRQEELLEERGVIVIRDFVKPESRDVILEFPDTEEGHFNGELLKKFSRTARSLSKDNEKGFPLNQIANNKFIINQVDVHEFIRRKDYVSDWEVELQEEYGYYTQNEFEQVFTEHGLRIIASGPIYNHWITENRYKEKFRITDLKENDLGYPATNYVIAAEKTVNRGTILKPIRNLPVEEEGFLKLNSYKSQVTGKIFDVAQRPNPVIDILPYYKEPDGSLKIVAKHGYPRPIVNQISRENTIDKKNYSGYMTESITAMKGKLTDVELTYETLGKRAFIKKDNVIACNKSLTFYTSPGGIDELVDSYCVELNKLDFDVKEAGEHQFSGFEESGNIRSYDALQFLKSIQVGAVPDVRLEINLYNLFYNLGISRGDWLNEAVTIPETNKLTPAHLENILESGACREFIHDKSKAGFLKHYRTKFYEYKREKSTSLFEYVEPDHFSSNTVTLLPVFSFNRKIHIGLESRNLPVPQLQEGNSFIPTIPAYRLPESVKTKTDLEKHINNLSVGGAQVNSYSKLGEKYLPCTGLTPEQVYPYVVSLNRPTEELSWVPVEELVKDRQSLRDGHLIVGLFRLLHALGH